MRDEVRARPRGAAKSPPQPPEAPPRPKPGPPPSLRERIASEPVTVRPLADAPSAAEVTASDAPRTAPFVAPSAPRDPALQLTPEERAARDAAPPPPPSRRFVLGTAGLAALAAGAG